MIDVRAFTVGPVQENAYLVRADAQATRALMIDPGEEPRRLLDAAAALGVEIEAILITHCHFDHVGAVAPVARSTAAPVYCPEVEVGVLADITKWTMPGFGPFESWEAEHSVRGGEHLSLAGLEIEVIYTPGHSPGHVTYAISAGKSNDGDMTPTDMASVGSHDESATSVDQASSIAPVLLSGDVLFQGSVGRVDLPGGDWATLERSIGTLMASFARDTVVYPGHMGITTLGREWDANPFLAELRASATSSTPPRTGAERAEVRRAEVGRAAPS
jgi:hydroxyacylglutathione hydrolase